MLEQRSSPRWQRLAQNLALSLGVFLLCAGSFELLLRLGRTSGLEQYTAEDPFLFGPWFVVGKQAAGCKRK